MKKPKKVTAILKLSENCNYNCEFCYYANKNHDPKKNMPIDLCKKIIKKCVLYNLSNNYRKCSLIFHGGEPMLRGIEYFKELIAYEKELEKEYEGLVFDNTIQTNGSLITEGWIDFFKQNNFVVGISLDGNENLNFHKVNSDDNNIDRVLSSYQKLHNCGVNVGILSVITDKHCENTIDFYNFLKKNNIKKVSILPCVNDSNYSTVNNQKLIRFYKDLFDLYFNGDYEVDIREFNDTIKRVVGHNSTTCKNCHRVGCGSFLTFDSQGNVFFCDEAYDKSGIICNINDTEIDEIFEIDKFISQRKECMEFYDNNCLKCEIKELCAGDCYRNDLKVGDKTINRFCDVSKEIYPYIKEQVYKSLEEE